jgi:hypothetical protein
MNPKMRLFLAILLACSASFKTAQPAAAAQTQDTAILFDIPLTFTGTDGSASANALIEVEVAGQTTLMILDNGVGYQMFATPFAQQHKLPIKGRIIGMQDHAGASLSGLRLHPIPMKIGTTIISLERAAAFDLPADFAKQGIAGLISPLSLIDSGYVVLDMPGKRMYALRADSTAARTLLRSRGYDPRKIAVRTDAAGDLYFPATLDQRYETWTALDLGAARTYFTARYSKATVTSKDCVMTGISGDCVGGALSNGHDVKFAGTVFRAMPIGIMETISGAASAKFRVEGLLGMDVLRNCVLALPRNSAHPVFMSCRAGE